MSIRTRDRRNSSNSNSTNTDASEIPNRFQPKKLQGATGVVSHLHLEAEYFPPNDFMSHQSSVEQYRNQPTSTSYFGQAVEMPHERQYSFAPRLMPVESESSLSLDRSGDERNCPPQYPTAHPPFGSYESYAYQAQMISPVQPQMNSPNQPHQQVQSINPALFSQFESLPQEVMFLLAEEEEHIRRFRSKVEKEKSRLGKDVDMIKDEISNLLENLKIQLSQQVDDHFKRYINVYGAFKEEIIKLKQQQLEAPIQLLGAPISKQDLSNASNKNLIRELEEIQHRSQMAKINQYIDELNRSRFLTITEISKDLLQITASGSQLYNSDNTQKSLNIVKQEMSNALIERFASFDLFVQPLDYLIKIAPQSRVQDKSNQQSRLQDYSIQKQKQDDYSIQKQQKQDDISIQKQKQDDYSIQGMKQNQVLNYVQKNTRPQQPLSNENYQPSYSQPFNLTDLPKPVETIPISNKITPAFRQTQQSSFQQNQQIPQQSQQFYQNQQLPQQPQQQLPNQSLQSSLQQLPQHCDPTHGLQINRPLTHLTLNERNTIQLNHKGMSLCVANVRDRLMATGGRDGLVKLWEGSSLLAELHASNGGVCCMAVIRQQGVALYLAAGSDNEENYLTIWSVQNFQKKSKLISHQAAVVALLSLDDGQTLISASYDKSVCIWNVEEETVTPLQKLSTAHTNAVTALALSPGKQRFVSGGLDAIINVWKIKTRTDGKFESTYLEKSIKNSSIVCSLNCVSMGGRGKVVSGAKDGRLRVWDILGGEEESQQQCCKGPIVEMVLFTHQETCMALAMSSKDNNLMLTNIYTGDNQVVDVQEKINIEFGCGVYPKMSLHKNTIYILSQSTQDQQVAAYDLIWE